MAKGSQLLPSPGGGPMPNAGVMPPPMFSGAGSLGAPPMTHGATALVGMAPPMAAPLLSPPATGVRDAMLRGSFGRGPGSPNGRM